MQKKIYIDEAGYTGYNFLDPDQPIFSIASLDIEPFQAEKILKDAFPDYKGREFKFSNLWNSKASGFKLIAARFKEHCLNGFVYIIDKKYATMIKMVDFLIEPQVTQAGYDFYKDGFCRKLANHMYYGFVLFESPEVLQDVLDTYQYFSRNPSEENLQPLKALFNRLYENATEPTHKMNLAQFSLGVERLPENSDIETFKKTNELQLSTMIAVVAWWRQRFQEDFVVIHDATANFTRQKETWDKITDQNALEYDHPLGNGTSVKFPLRVSETVSVNSLDCYSVQLCDLIAGFFSKAFNPTRTTDQIKRIEELLALGFSEIAFDGIAPIPEFEELNPHRLDGPDAADLMTRLIHPDKNE